MGEQPAEDTCCPYSTACSGARRSSLRSTLARYFRSDDERRDVIANILHQVQDVLEPAH